ncbi:MAG: hypothetical protein JWN44_1093 [Myxococcales bacterium]|nr:hypothetical protein [Myxococcales bacterium]
MKTLGALAALCFLATPAAAKVKKPITPPVDAQLQAPSIPFNPEEASRNIRARMSIVRACFERASRREPGIEGKLQLGFEIGAAGQVASTQVEVNGLRAPVDPSAANGLASCIRQQALSWKLASDDSAVGGHVSYVFVFEAAN